VRPLRSKKLNYLKKEASDATQVKDMASPVDISALFGQFLQIIPWVMVVALLPVLLKSIVEAVKEFRA